MDNQGRGISNEEVSPGPIPKWLLRHLISQLSEDKSFSDGGIPRILVIYPNTESRREVTEFISNQGFVIDNTLHLTISSLMDSIMTDIRMPWKFNHGE